MEIKVVQVKIPSEANAVIGGCNFIKTAQDLYETLAESSPSIKFGLAFCEASGKKLVRSEGNDAELVKAAENTAKEIGAGHSFIIFLKNAFPVNVLNRIKAVSEVTTIYAATANPLQVLVAETLQGRGIIGVVDGEKPVGIEGEADKRDRREFIKKLGYKT